MNDSRWKRVRNEIERKEKYRRRRESNQSKLWDMSTFMQKLPFTTFLAQNLAKIECKY